MSFVLSKLLWAVLAPGSLLALLLAGGTLATTMPYETARRTGRRICGFVAVALFLLALLPLGDWALVPLENRFATTVPLQVDGIILLGGDERPALTEARGQPVALESLRRYMLFADLSRRYPEARLVFTGGSPLLNRTAHMGEADIARDILTKMGVDADRVTYERASRNTFENARLTADIVRPEPTQTWLLVTSAHHMPRSVGVFRKAGWNVVAAPAGYYTAGAYGLTLWEPFDEQMRELTAAVREYIGLVAYYLMGRTSALWPAP